MTWTLVVLVLLALVLWGFYVSWRASRLDRLHNRCEGARTALDLAMVRRSAVSYELASAGLLDPATSLLLTDAARRAKDAGRGERDLAESDLTRALRATIGQPGFRASLNGAVGAGELLDEVEAAAHQVYLARKFYNDVAARTIEARHRPLVRVLHLAGTAKQPEFFEMDDALGPDDTTP
jgi:hypothetical protein